MTSWPECVGCGKPCIPMADYEDRPVCHRCDAAADSVLARAAITPLVEEPRPVPAPVVLDMWRRIREAVPA